MVDRTFGVPLAFALALSAPGWDALQSKEAPELLVPGSLGPLVSRSLEAMPGDALTSESNGPGLKGRIAQWFNANPCIKGTFRKC
jgi:hypothetical protein